jgi:hypothetical protein
MSRLLVVALLSSTLFGVSGCSSGQCSKAQSEESRLSKKMDFLASRYVKSEEKLVEFIQDYCKDRGVGNKTLLDASGDDIWCDDWRRTGNVPIVGGSERRELADKIEDFKYKFESTQNRWALTVTTYKECFEPSLVIDATEILDN